MNKKFTLSFAFISVAFAFIFFNQKVISNTFQAPSNRAGEPGSNTCAQCHNGGTADTNRFVIKMDTTLTGLSNASSQIHSGSLFIPGKTYYMSLQLLNPTAVSGFEMAPVTNGTVAGSWTITNNTNTILNTNNPVGKYLSHKNANANNNWVFKWNAPSTVTPVTFYYTGVWANGNGNDGNGDITYKGNTVLFADTFSSGNVGIIEETKNIQQLAVYPTASTGSYTVSFDLLENADTKIDILNLNGQIVETIYNDRLESGNFKKEFNLASLNAGNYFVHIKSGNQAKVKQIIKL